MRTSDGPFLSRKTEKIHRIFVYCTQRLGPKKLGPFRKIDLNFGGSTSKDTQPNCFAFFKKGCRTLSTTLLWSFIRLTISQPLVQKRALFTELAARLRFAIRTDGRMPRRTRGVRATSTKVILAPFPDGLLPLGGVPFEELFTSLFVCHLGVGEEKLVILSRLLSLWRKLHASPFVHFPLAF